LDEVGRFSLAGLSKSQVSITTGELDEEVEAFRSHPLDQGSYTFVAADAHAGSDRE